MKLLSLNIMNIKHTILAILISCGLVIAFWRHWGDVQGRHGMGGDQVTCVIKAGLGLEEHKTVRKEWRPRWLASFTEAQFVNIIKNDYTKEIKIDINSLWRAAGWHGALFLSLCCIAYCIRFQGEKESWMAISLTGAALSYTYLMEHNAYRFMPWDIPALAAWTIMVCSFNKNIIIYSLAVTIGVLYKETCILGVIPLFFWSDFKSKKIYALIILFVCIIEKTIIGYITGSQFWSPSHDCTDPKIYWNGWLIFYNGQHLFTEWPHTPLLVGCGTILAMWLFKPQIYWTITGVFLLAGLFIFGSITEVRIFLELVPISIITILDNKIKG